ncbi:MAG: glycosyltransferase [Ignavibacteriaceae bacterium]|jgi:processive 1,2-diacylglycerol beta-glucosyltransferase/1,2-diacylglycerol 3-beta-galactosyltransferase|nr:glycosyltransferase [Ignavibacteriaceae bacterium]MCW9096744.1 glycosyltransferase [Ignavibacteriaceae bacterium]
MSEKKKYLFVYLKTGGGHLAPARAIFNYMNKHFSDTAEPKLIYGFEKTPRWVQFIIEDGYRMLQYTGKWFFEFLYAINKIPLVARVTCNLIAPFMKKYLEEVILKEQPDKIVIFHFFCIIPVFKILRKNKLSIPVQTVITDPFTPHPMWFLEKRQDFIVFSKDLEEKIIKMKKNYPVKNFPFVIDDKFSTSLSSDKIISVKKRFEYDPAKKMILILGGGDGIPKGERILEKILEAQINTEIGIVCGKNEVLQKGIENLKKRYKADHLKIYSYVDFIYELINISNVVITKCGASTIMEILNLKKVPVVNDYIWEQEQGNVDYLIDKKLGIYEPKIEKLPGIVKKLLEDEQFYLSYKENILKEKINNGVKELSEYIRN